MKTPDPAQEVATDRFSVVKQALNTLSTTKEASRHGLIMPIDSFLSPTWSTTEDGQVATFTVRVAGEITLPLPFYNHRTPHSKRTRRVKRPKCFVRGVLFSGMEQLGMMIRRIVDSLNDVLKGLGFRSVATGSKKDEGKPVFRSFTPKTSKKTTLLGRVLANLGPQEAFFK